jgi:hypothetical protein
MNTANNIIDFPENDDVTRAKILNLLVRTKRFARLGLRAMNKCFDTKRKARRLKSLLDEGEVSPFHSHRLGTLHDAIVDCDAHLDELCAGMAQLGNIVLLMSPFVDQVLSFEEKAHVLGTSPERLQKKIARYSHLAKTSPCFAYLVFIYNAEIKDDKEGGFIDLYSENEPLMNAVFECMLRKLQEDQEFANATTTFLEDMGMTFHTRKENPDGTTRLAPRLRVVKRSLEAGLEQSPPDQV